MERFFRRIVALLEWWAVLLLIMMTAVVLLGVFFRYVLNASLAWYDEFASYLLVWLTFYGAVVALYRRRHIGFEVVMNRLLPETRRIFDLVAESFVLGFQIVLFYYGWYLTRKMGDETAVSLVMQTAKGALKLLESGKDGPSAWSAKVSSPGGTTIHGLHVLESAGFKGILIAAVEAAVARSKELSGR